MQSLQSSILQVLTEGKNQTDAVKESYNIKNGSVKAVLAKIEAMSFAEHIDLYNALSDMYKNESLAKIHDGSEKKVLTKTASLLDQAADVLDGFDA